MALTLFLLSSLTGIIFAESIMPTTPSALKPTLDPKRRNEVVDEAFLEQKDILLDMLESKLKDVRDKKKKKSDRSETNTEGGKCESLPGNVDLKLKSNGLSALGETDLLMKFGNSGKGTLNLDASGISNVGKARLELAVGDGSIYVPGLNNLFVGKQYLNNCNKQNETEAVVKERHTQTLGTELLDYRRGGPNVNGDNSTNNDAVNKGVNKDDQNNTETTNIDTNTTLNGNGTTTNFTVVELPTTVALENDIMDLRNNATNP